MSIPNRPLFRRFVKKQKILLSLIVISGSKRLRTRRGCKKMHTYILEGEQWLPKSLDEMYLFFSRPENLQVLTPSWIEFRKVEAPAVLAVGSLIRYRLRWRGLPIRWTTEISEWNPPHGFVDREVRGPYGLWNHEHWFFGA